MDWSFPKLIFLLPVESYLPSCSSFPSSIPSFLLLLVLFLIHLLLLFIWASFANHHIFSLRKPDWLGSVLSKPCLITHLCVWLSNFNQHLIFDFNQKIVYFLYNIYLHSFTCSSGGKAIMFLWMNLRLKSPRFLIQRNTNIS